MTSGRVFRIAVIPGGVPSPLRNATAETMDWVVVRDNTEGEYAGIGEP